MPKDVYKNAEKNLKKLHAGELGRIAKLKRTAKELVMGSKTYLKKDSGGKKDKKQIDKWRYKTRKKQAEVKKATRTKVIESELSKAGLSAKEIARFGGK